MIWRSAILATAAPLLLAPATDDLGYHPEEGSVVRKTFREETTWELKSVTQAVNGNELDMDAPEMEGLVERDVEVVDELVEVGEGRPAALRRTFAETGRNAALDFFVEGIEAAYDFDLETPLDGRTVLYRWNEDDEDWDVELDGENADAELGGLREDMDLRALLPGEEVGEEDWWTVDASELADVFRPGGNLVFTRDEPPEGQYMALTPTDVIATAMIAAADASADIDGEATLQWNETREEDGVSFAVIEVLVEAKLSAELTDELVRLVEDSNSGGKNEPEFAIEWQVEGQGELVWNLTAGRFESLELTLEGPAAVDSSWNQGGEADFEIEMSAEMVCKTTLSARAEDE